MLELMKIPTHLKTEEPDEDNAVSSEADFPLKTLKNLKDCVFRSRKMLTESTCRWRGGFVLMRGDAVGALP